VSVTAGRGSRVKHRKNARNKKAPFHRCYYYTTAKFRRQEKNQKISGPNARVFRENRAGFGGVTGVGKISVKSDKNIFLFAKKSCTMAMGASAPKDENGGPGDRPFPPGCENEKETI